MKEGTKEEKGGRVSLPSPTFIFLSLPSDPDPLPVSSLQHISYVCPFSPSHPPTSTQLPSSLFFCLATRRMPSPALTHPPPSLALSSSKKKHINKKKPTHSRSRGGWLHRAARGGRDIYIALLYVVRYIYSFPRTSLLLLSLLSPFLPFTCSSTCVDVVRAFTPSNKHRQ